MIKDFILSFKDNISQKAKNPFLGIYVIVWAIRNWELVYSVFNFDDDVKRENKIVFIKNYFVEKPFLTNIFWNILISTGVLIGTYLLLNLSRLIVNFYDKIVSPWVYKITDKSSIVTKEEYLQLERKNEHLEQKIDDLKKERNELQNEIELTEKNSTTLSNRIKELLIENAELLDKTKKLPSLIKRLEEQNDLFEIEFRKRNTQITELSEANNFSKNKIKGLEKDIKEKDQEIATLNNSIS